MAAEGCVDVKRDFDLLRNMLLRIEAAEPGRKLDVGSFAGLCDDDNIIALHIELLHEAGFVKLADPYSHEIDEMAIVRMTFAGYEYLDAIRDGSNWKAIKEKLLPVGGSTSIEIVKELGVSFLRQQLGF